MMNDDGNYQRSWTMASSEGPVPTQDTLTPVCLSMNRMQSTASLGRCSALVILVMSCSQPLRVSYTTSTLARSSRDPGKESNSFPLSLQATATLMFLKLSKISNLVKFQEEKPLIMFVYLSNGRSSHPQRRGLPVVVPNSWPFALIIFPVSSFNSVGKGPSPTLVTQALATPIIVSILFGAIPRPVHTPPIDVEDEVTQGYVPRSISRRLALAPSAKTVFPYLILRLIQPTDSTIIFFSIRTSLSFFSSASSVVFCS